MKFEAIGKQFSGAGRLINLDNDQYSEVLIDRCTFTGGGIYILAKPGMKITITHCTATNVTRGKEEYGNFVQIAGPTSSSHPVPVTALIANNTVRNEPGHSSVEDNINLYNISGAVVRFNQIWGAYPIDLSLHGLKTYSGSGIMVDFGSSNCLIQGNSVHDTTNVGIGISSGQNNQINGNTIKAASAQNVGLAIWNNYKNKPFGNNSQKNNDITWMTPLKPPGRNDLWIE